MQKKIICSKIYKQGSLPLEPDSCWAVKPVNTREGNRSRNSSDALAISPEGKHGKRSRVAPSAEVQGRISLQAGCGLEIARRRPGSRGSLPSLQGLSIPL